MHGSSLPALAAGLLLFTASSGVAEDALSLKPQSRVRIHAGQVREIPGVVKIGSSVEMRGGEVVANTDRFIAVKVSGRKDPVCLPRPGATLSGRLLALDAEDWTIAVDGQKAPFTIPRYAIDTVDVGRGHQRAKAILRGAGAGLLVGGALGLAAGAGCGDSWGCPGPGGGAVVLGIPGAALGALFGALGGDAGWKRVPVDQVRLNLGSRHDLAVGISLAFPVRIGPQKTP
jgi:hypothetical protein